MRLFVKAMQQSDEVMLSLGREGLKLSAFLEVTCPTTDAAAVLATQLRGLTALLRDLLSQKASKPIPRFERSAGGRRLQRGRPPGARTLGLAPRISGSSAGGSL
jgi:hypothetical protein